MVFDLYDHLTSRDEEKVEALKVYKRYGRVHVGETFSTNVIQHITLLKIF